MWEKILLDITYECQLRCWYCFNLPFLNSRFRLKKEEILDWAARTKVLEIGGGEPTLYPGFEELLEELAGFPNLNKVIVSTNGLRLSRFSHPKVQYQVSLPALDEKPYARVTQTKNPDLLKRVFKNINYYKIQNPARVLINTVVSEINLGEIPKLAEFAHDQGLPIRFNSVKFQNLPRDFERRFWEMRMRVTPSTGIIWSMSSCPENCEALCNQRLYISPLKRNSCPFFRIGERNEN